MRLKRIHLRRGKESLEVKCLRDGTLDVRLNTGIVLGLVRGAWIPKSLRRDEDGYLGFCLNREKVDRRGKPSTERRGRKIVHRYRERRYVLVHRLVKIKAIAVALGGRNWRKFARDLPPGIDVNHLPGVRRDDNRHRGIELATERANRARDEMTPEEIEAVNNCPF
jgi:hypothetical protein